METLVGVSLILGMLGFVVFLILLIISLFKKKHLKRNFIGFLVCSVVFCVSVSALPSSGESIKDFSEPNASEPNAKEYDVEITATELLAAYDANEVAADNEYKDKILSVNGTIRDIGKDLRDRVYITLQDENNEFSILSVQCFFDDKDQIDGIAELSSGKEITVIGKCDGKTLNVVLKDCKFQ